MAINKQKYEIIIIKEETRDVERSLSNLKSLLPNVNIDIENISALSHVKLLNYKLKQEN